MKKRVNITIDGEIQAKAIARCKELQISFSGFAERLIANELGLETSETRIRGKRGLSEREEKFYKIVYDEVEIWAKRNINNVKYFGPKDTQKEALRVSRLLAKFPEKLNTGYDNNETVQGQLDFYLRLVREDEDLFPYTGPYGSILTFLAYRCQNALDQGLVRKEDEIKVKEIIAEEAQRQRLVEAEHNSRVPLMFWERGYK